MSNHTPFLLPALLILILLFAFAPIGCGSDTSEENSPDITREDVLEETTDSEEADVSDDTEPEDGTENQDTATTTDDTSEDTTPEDTLLRSAGQPDQ